MLKWWKEHTSCELYKWDLKEWQSPRAPTDDGAEANRSHSFSRWGEHPFHVEYKKPAARGVFSALNPSGAEAPAYGG